MYTTGSEILTHVGIDPQSASDDELLWAESCANAIEGGIQVEMDSVTPDAFSVDQLEVAALTDGAALYQSKAAPNGILSMGPDGQAVRVGADQLRACMPIIHRVHPTAGIALV